MLSTFMKIENHKSKQWSSRYSQFCIVNNRVDHTSEYLGADKSENGEMTAEEQKGIKIPGSCKEMIVKEAECYAKQMRGSLSGG